MMKNWINRAIGLLDNSLNPLPHELNELDWKEDLSPKNNKLSKHISAFANHPGGGFLVFGIRDRDGTIIGVNRENAEVIVQRLSSLARDTLNPVVSIDHSIESYDGANLLLIYIKESSIKPVHLNTGTVEDTFIRSGGTTQKASRHEVGSLMLNSKNPNFEELHVSKLKTVPQILDAIDYRSVYKLLDKPIPQNNDEIISWMKEEKMIDEFDGAGYYITNFGAISSAYKLSSFDGVARKVIRVIKYKGITKAETIKEYPGSKGYAIGFQGLIDFVLALLPSSEVIKTALRKTITVYPEIALRELIANALIHQDFGIKGAGPMIEIFDDRIEISNPGKLLPSKSIDRLIRTTPESRNEILAHAFRRYNICEERGSGYEKAVTAIELFGLPPLKIEELTQSFRVTMYAPKTFAELTPTERIEAAYQHSVLKYFSSGGMTNKSLRERFKVNEKKRSQVSRVINEAVELRKIKPRDPNNTSTKFIEYIPIWG